MAKCHKRSLKLMRTFLNDLDHLDPTRAIEVAAGDGKVTQDLLKARYKFIDAFDQCSNAVK